MIFRTDLHHNPTAFTTALAEQAGLALGPDYTQGDPFTVNGKTFYTARLHGDPIALTVRLIDAVSFFTSVGYPRWEYVRSPHFIWLQMNQDQKRDFIGWMYQHEGGTEMRKLFPKYGDL